MIIFLLSIGLIVKITGDILRLTKAVRQIKTTEKQVSKLKEEKEKLSQEYQYYSSEDFIEEEARNKLNMARPGETIVILPPNLEELLSRPKTSKESFIPNWKKWWNLFF